MEQNYKEMQRDDKSKMPDCVTYWGKPRSETEERHEKL